MLKAFGVFFLLILCAPVVAGVTVWQVNNGLVDRDEAVNQTYAQVQNVLQRQAELIPNLVEVVKGAANIESSTLEKIISARNSAAQIAKLAPADVANDPEKQKALMNAVAGMGQAMVAINAVREAYPVLQSQRGFINLFAELAGSQNRITVERRRNQLAVEDYNRTIRRFPHQFLADYKGLKPKPYFAADDSSQRAPTVKF